MMDSMTGSGGWGMGFGGIFMLLFWALVILVIVVLAKSLLSRSKSERPPKTARQILDERYARGDIDRDEFEQKKRDMQGE